MRELIIAIGLLLFIEGMLYALFPSKMKNMLKAIEKMQIGQLRISGLLFAIIGFGVLWFITAGFNPMYIFYSLIAAAFVFMAMRYTNKKKVRMDKPMQQNIYIQGDNITKTEVKDSVLNRSNIGSDGKSKAEQVQNIKELLDSGAIDDDEFKQMKKEILGK